jgi:isoleucyl-tRNA synthetase
VPLIEITPSGHSPLVLKAQSSTLEKEAAEESFAYLSEFVSFTTLDGHVGVEDAEVVFVGYGVVAPEYGWNDYEGIDVRGKAVVCLVNDPGFLHNDPSTHMMHRAVCRVPCVVRVVLCFGRDLTQ